MPFRVENVKIIDSAPPPLVQIGYLRFNAGEVVIIDGVKWTFKQDVHVSFDRSKGKSIKWV